MKTFAIWAEGYKATGEWGQATLMGRASGKTFKEACKNLAKTMPSFASYFDEERLTFWGCRLFDNEVEARKAFG